MSTTKRPALKSKSASKKTSPKAVKVRAVPAKSKAVAQKAKPAARKATTSKVAAAKASVTTEFRLPSAKIIRDPLHDLIRVEPSAVGLIETPAFQRLRKIRQLGLAMLVYPGAEHSRFIHSVGAYHLARRVVRALLDLDKKLFTNDEQVAIPLAALCHDIGHGPFSHLFERVSRQFISKDDADHETWTRRIIKEDPEISKVLKAVGAEIPGIVFDIINKAHKHKYVSDIVSSQMDVDRFDYLMRDSFMTGVKYGDLDLNWMLRTLQVGQVQKGTNKALIKTLALDGRRGLSSLESYILGRHYMYMHVYYHKTIQAAESMLTKLLALAVEETGKGNLKATHSVFESLSKKKVPSLSDYLSLNDFSIFSLMEQWEKQKGPIGDLSKRLNSRNIFSCVPMPTNLSHTARLEKDKKTRDLLKENKLDPDIYLIFHDPQDRAFKDLYFHIQAGKEAEHQEIYYLDRTGNTKTLSTSGSFVGKLNFREERLYVPKELYSKVSEIWLG